MPSIPRRRAVLGAALTAAVGLLAAPPPASAAPAAATRTSWMGRLPDTTPVTSMSLPGTHDSGAWTGSVWSRTQDLTLTGQLDSGVRFLDVRTRHYRDAFTIHHGAEYLHLNFTDVVRDVSAFLARHPAETVLMRMKKEHTEEENTRTYEETLDHYIQHDPDTRDLLTAHLWVPGERGGDRVPSLGEARGRIVIVQDFAATRDYGVRWNGPALDIQDDYRVPTLFDIPDKWEKARAHFGAAASGPEDILYVNHLSGSGAPWANPREVAWGAFGLWGVNEYALDHLRGSTAHRTGVVVMDFPSQELTDLVLARNPRA
ncbi:phosphatidylinositol-specific phospholipase C [Nocardiopsis sp. EMB25]|uniref:phosphatidylinositol-specific phospholipase C n=1 Tax=Nocardiopsis sp. EMB25 TaxID=2835867 RepID=UPI0022845278|nr:phosphatidylinositol-specific phospholipase C [Nocardiopsis sp. EMB25]MCY9783500.1 phosphatidylinositol-specific phospholipase C [Nocardiopsis sp. EMB25]